MSTLIKPLLSKLVFLIFLIFISISTVLNSSSLVYRCGLASKLLQDSDLYFQETKKALSKFKTNSEEGTMSSWSTNSRRRKLTGPGSSPPRCMWKCGRCTPCKPVHVPVPPGNPVTAEYYPEAWRCKCGNKLYMP